MSEAIPVTIITGFLGSGKTTVLNHLLQDPRLTDTAVIVNEFGAIGLDHLLLGKAVDNAVLMDNGCLCCSIRGDLADTLEDLRAQVAAGRLPGFSRVIVETTGLANPGPIVAALGEGAAAGRYRLQGVVAAVDGVNGVETLARHPEAQAQVAMADLILVTKGDLAEARPGAALHAARRLSPHAEALLLRGGALDPAAILGLQTAAIPSAAPADHGHHHDEDHHGHHHHDHGQHDCAAPGHVHGPDCGHGAMEHAFDVASASLRLPGPLDWEELAAWLDWLLALRGADLLRVKGLIAVKGHDGPVLVQAVQGVFSPPRVLEAWPDADRESRIVLIARGIPGQALAASFQGWRQAA